MKHRLLLLLMCLLLVLPAMAQAGDCFTIDADQLDMNSLSSDAYVSRHLSSSAQGLRVRKHISSGSEAAAHVRLTFTEMNSRSLIFDKVYGYQSGTFDSGVIYLPYMGEGTTPYLVTLYVGDYVYAIPYMHLQARLTRNGACTFGPRLSDLSAALDRDWLMGTMLDLNRLERDGSQIIDICASNQYVVGTAQVTLSGGELRVEALFHAHAGVELHEASVYVVTDCASFANGHFPAAHALGDWVDVSGAETALLYLPMQISYDPSGLSPFWYDRGALSSQFSLWNSSRSGAAGSPGTGGQSSGWEDDDWSGWSDDGWDNTIGWDDSGWQEGSGW